MGLLAKLPETLEREELVFTDERRAAIFKHADQDGLGAAVRPQVDLRVAPS